MSEHVWHVERVGDERGLSALRELWDTLLRSIPDHDLFHTWEWLNTWHRHHHNAGDLWLLTARRSTGELAGILPLRRVTRRFGPLRIRVLTTLMFRPPIHHAVIAPPIEEPGVFAAFAQYLAERRAEWDVLHLDGFDASEAAMENLDAFPGARMVRTPAQVALVSLPPDWQTYEMEHLSGSRRRNIRRLVRRLDRDHPGTVVYERLIEPDEVRAAFEQLVEMNRDRWQERDIASSFDDVRFVAFNREIAALALDCGWLRFYRLSIGGEVAALNYCFAYNGVLCGYQMAFNPRWAEYRPGTLLFVHLLKESINEQIRVIDMLRTDGQNWKSPWQTTTELEHHIIVGRGLRGRAWLLAARLSDAVQRAALTLLPESALDRLRALQRRVTRL